MKPYTILIFISLFSLSVNIFSQEKLIPLQVNPVLKQYVKSHPEIINKTLTNSDTINIPFFDDFSTYNLYPADSLWIDNFAFINNGYANNPFSIGVATLDAVSFDGSMYETAGSEAFIADYLTSKPIHLSSFTKADSVYFSFTYQPQGNGDAPEMSDSLVLEFYSPYDSHWHHEWSVAGSSLKKFSKVIIQLVDTLYLLDGFQFRFYNYASLTGTFEASWAGNVDHWNLDYIYLDKNRNKLDTTYRDFAITNPLKSILKNYESMPWSHFKANNSELNDSITIYTRNNDFMAHNEYRLFEINDLLGNALSYEFSGASEDFNAYSNSTIVHTFEYSFNSDSQNKGLFEIKFYFNAQEFDMVPNNDTVKYYQIFDNYYAYDDGTAENGYGLSGEGSQNAKLAYKFQNFKTSEKLRAVEMYFNQTLNDESQKYFYLTVWNNDEENNIPDSIIYSQIGIRPEYGDSLNDFYRYILDTPLVVPSIFYVGWTQTTTDLLNVGFDKNRNTNENNQVNWLNPCIFYNISGNWEQSSFEGALMIRPLFSNDTILYVPEMAKNDEIKVFPNPANDNISIQIPDKFSNDNFTVTLFDCSGKEILRSAKTEAISIENLKQGFYFISVQSASGLNYHSKILVIH